MIYLIIPYSKVDKNEAYRIATGLAASFFKKGMEVFSPITYSHHIAKSAGKNVDWVKFDLQILQTCNIVYVVVWPDRQAVNDSIGCRKELKASIKQGKIIRYIDYKGKIL